MQDSLDAKIFSLPYLLTAIAGTAVVVGGAAWGLATYNQSNELEAYRQAKQWRVGESISALRQLSSKINITLTERKELEQLRITSRKVTELEQRAASLLDERNRLSSALHSATKNSPRHEVAQGSSSYLIPNLLMVAVVSSYSGSNRCDVRIGNYRASMEVGETIGGMVSGIDYKVSLTRVTTGSCEFAYSQES